MAEEAKNKASASKFRTSIGGQALIEGVLMRGPGKQAVVVRSPDGLVEKVEELTLVRDKYPVLGLPIIRGAVTFVDSMVKGVKALMFSSDYFPDEDVAEPSKFDQWLEKKLGNEKMQKFITALAVFLSLGLTILLFFLLPTFLAGFIDPYIKSAAVHNLVESVIKLVIFFAYMILCSKQKDIYRVFQYHGAEHKTIFCYEAGAAADGRKLPHPAAPPSALRHELSLCGRGRVDFSLEPCVQLCQLAQHVGAHGAAPAAAHSNRGRDV